MKVSMVTTLLPKSNYARFLAEGFRALPKSPVNIVYYKGKMEGNAEMPFDVVKDVWSRNALYPFQIFREVLRDRPEIVHVQHEIYMYGGVSTTIAFPLVLLLLRLTHSKIVVTVHQVPSLGTINKEFAKAFSFPQKLSILLTCGFCLIFKTISILSSAIIVHANCFRSSLIHDYGATKDHVFVIPIGVPENKGNCSAISGKWITRLHGGKDVILFFGYLSKRKGVEYLIEAFQHIAEKFPNYVLLIAGGVLPYTRQYVEMLRTMISERNMKERIVLTTKAPLPINEIHQLYSQSQFVALPYTYSISSSLPLSFAVQHHKPVIATDIGSFKEEIKHLEEGLLCPSKNAIALEKAIERLIENKDLRERLSEGMKKKAERLSWPSIAQRTCEVYWKVLRMN